MDKKFLLGFGVGLLISATFNAVSAVATGEERGYSRKQLIHYLTKKNAVKHAANRKKKIRNKADLLFCCYVLSSN